MQIQKVAILGSTGSVGTQALEVVQDMGLSVSLLTAWSKLDTLTEQIRVFHPETVFVPDPHAAAILRERLGEACPRVLCDQTELLHAIRTTDADCILHAIAGLAGIPAAIAAADSGKRVAMANKEAVIVLGERLWTHIRRSGGELIPVDSEHSAIFQCLQASPQASLKRILLTASGGPFFGYTKEQLSHVTREQTLAHPTWRMGPKITVDSATLMNKGFEIMEAVRLFHVPETQVEVLIHRQSIIHSMVEYTDNTVIAQLAPPDMRYCIRYAFTHPQRDTVTAPGLDFAALAQLTFAAPDENAFPLLRAAKEAIRADGAYPTALIAADEAAVDAFLREEIPFSAIAPAVMETMAQMDIGSVSTIEDVLDTVDHTKRKTAAIIQHIRNR